MKTLLASLLALTCFLPPATLAAPVDDAVTELQRDWEVIRYQTPAAEREKRFEALATRAHQASESFPGRSEPLVWEGIVVSSLAGEKGGLGALGLVKQAKVIYERAIGIDGGALEGSAYNSLGVLYYKVPGWPVGFGDKAKAKELLLKALALNPKGIDPNFFYGEYLVETGHADEAVVYLERALQVGDRLGGHIVTGHVDGIGHIEASKRRGGPAARSPTPVGARRSARCWPSSSRTERTELGDHPDTTVAGAVAQRQAVQGGDALRDRDAQAAADLGLALGAVEAFAQMRQRLGW